MDEAMTLYTEGFMWSALINNAWQPWPWLSLVKS